MIRLRVARDVGVDVEVEEGSVEYMTGRNPKRRVEIVEKPRTGGELVLLYVPATKVSGEWHPESAFGLRTAEEAQAWLDRDD